MQGKRRRGGRGRRNELLVFLVLLVLCTGLCVCGVLFILVPLEAGKYLNLRWDPGKAHLGAAPCQELSVSAFKVGTKKG